MKSNWKFDKEVVARILDKAGRDDRYSQKSMAKLTFEQLYSQLEGQEIAIVKQLLALNPVELGFHGPFVSLENPPNDLVLVEGQAFERAGKRAAIVNQYLPQRVWKAF